MCKRNFSLDENYSGLVFDDTHFLCEICHGSHSDLEVDDWVHSELHDESKGMPIGLWLIHEKNKNKTIMSMSTKNL